MLVGRSLDTIVSLVFADDGSRLIVADVAEKTFEFRVVTVYAPNLPGERCSFFRRLGLFLDDPKWTVLEGDWNVILNPKIDKGGWGANGSGRCESSLIDLMAKFDLIDRFHLDHLGREMWTWLGDFWERLGNLIQRALVVVVTGNRRWESLKYRIRDFVIKYGRQLKLDRAKKAKSLEDRLSRAVEGGTL